MWHISSSTTENLLLHSKLLFFKQFWSHLPLTWFCLYKQNCSVLFCKQSPVYCFPLCCVASANLFTILRNFSINFRTSRSASWQSHLHQPWKSVTMFNHQGHFPIFIFFYTCPPHSFLSFHCYLLSSCFHIQDVPFIQQFFCYYSRWFLILSLNMISSTLHIPN